MSMKSCVFVFLCVCVSVSVCVPVGGLGVYVGMSIISICKCVHAIHCVSEFI